MTWKPCRPRGQYEARPYDPETDTQYESLVYPGHGYMVMRDDKCEWILTREFFEMEYEWNNHSWSSVEIFPEEK